MSESMEEIIADVFAMMGSCATLSGNTTKKSRSVQDVKRYEPKTEFGRRLQATVADEISKMKTKSDQPTTESSTSVRP